MTSVEMKQKTCCFTGHRAIPDKQRTQIFARLTEAIEKKIQEGVLYFGAGGALGFDSIAEFAVLNLKNKYPDIKLILVLPCPNQDKFWSEKDKALLQSVIERADKVTYAESAYTRTCMHKRNRHLVDNSAHCICYLTEDTGGTAYTVGYAHERGLDVVNIADMLTD